ncbi:uncharacterized protein LOC118664588 [Myotis myotis]|uniref:uncharacterized protein LOC118664588 n=1 Tax=Myotis myotis TaxID=51298 RepID=UPI0017496EC7|nr:uncharacterized protein LOC118664588 [Myotis myotis]
MRIHLEYSVLGRIFQEQRTAMRTRGGKGASHIRGVEEKKQCKLPKVRFAAKCEGARKNVPNVFLTIIHKILVLAYQLSGWVKDGSEVSQTIIYLLTPFSSPFREKGNLLSRVKSCESEQRKPYLKWSGEAIKGHFVAAYGTSRKKAVSSLLASATATALSLLIANKNLPKLQTLALHQWTPVQNTPPHFLLELNNKTDCPFASSDLPTVCHSLHVPNCNSSVIPK